MLYSYGACIFTVIYLPACLHLPIMKCSGLVNVELNKKIREQSERKKIYGLTNPKMLPPPLIHLVLRHSITQSHNTSYSSYQGASVIEHIKLRANHANQLH